MLGSCRGQGSAFFKPLSSFAFQVSVPGDRQSSGQGFLHLAQEGCRKAEAQKRYGKGSLLSRWGPAPRWVTTARLKRTPHGAALKSFLLSQVQRGVLRSCCRGA